MPPASATAIASSGEQAPAIGASRIGSASPYRSQNCGVTPGVCTRSALTR